MRLRIKETGELLEDVKFIDTTLHKITIQYLDDGVLRECTIKNLSDIEEVKDYEEPKKYWYITGEGDICRDDIEYSEWTEERKSIGNYFETKEEAEKAVEKLKAWKRLKDKGFRFNRWTIPEEPKTPHIKLVLEAEMDVPDSPYDLDLLFGGEK